MVSSGKVFIISCGVGVDSLTPQMLHLIKEADILIGGTRLLEFIPKSPTQRLPIKNNIKEIIQLLEDRISTGDNSVILASGDALFHGIGRAITNSIPEKHITIIPNITAFQAAMSKLLQPWEGAQFFSIHGRNTPLPWRDILNSPLAIIYGDYRHSASDIATYLVDSFSLSKNRAASIVQNLGEEEEGIQKGSLAELAKTTASGLSMLILFNDENSPMPGLPLGRPDSEYKHENNLITHSETRAVILSKLQLHTGIMWDIGAGSGSVGIEAAMLVPSLTVHAIEKNENRITLIENNCTTYGVNNLNVHHGNALEKIENLPTPNFIFIGGGGKDITELLEISCKRVKKNGRIVVSAVTLETQHRVREFFKDKTIEHVSMSITRSHKVANLHIMKPENSIDIFVYHHL